MNNALFLDRDGVINYPIIRSNKPYAPNNLDELKIIPEIKHVINKFKKKGFKIFVITNQPDVSRGKADIENIKQINFFIQEILDIDYFFVCFHDDIDNCDCRKPKPGAFFILKEKFNIDLGKSVMIGDRYKDIEAATNAGCPSIFIDYDYDEKKPTTQFKTINCIGALLQTLEDYYEES